MGKPEIIDLPLSQVWFVSMDDQDFSHAAIPQAVHKSLGFHSRLPQGANVVRVGIGWPQDMLSHNDFTAWYDSVKTTLALGMEPAEYSYGGPRFGGRVVGTQFVGKMTQSVALNEVYGRHALASGIKHMVYTGGAASDCLGDSVVDTVRDYGIDCTVLANATADSKDGVKAGFYERMLGANVGLSYTSHIKVQGGRVQIKRVTPRLDANTLHRRVL